MCSTTANDRSAPSGLQGYRLALGARLIECSRIRPAPDQLCRKHDSQTQEELNDSVKRFGILQPITVCYVPAEDVYRIVAGRRPFAAACAAGLTEIPCWLQSPEEEEVLLHEIVATFHRPEIRPYDLADAVARLKDANGYTQRDLARLIGKSEAKISKVLALLELAPAVQNAARDDQSGRITCRHLYALSRLPAEEQLSLLFRAQEDGISATDLEKIVKRRMASLTRRKRRRTRVGQRRFHTSRGVVGIMFRKRDVRAKDVLAAIEEVRQQVYPSPPHHAPY
jgi:ParB family chromosome partitioning protein